MKDKISRVEMPHLTENDFSIAESISLDILPGSIGHLALITRAFREASSEGNNQSVRSIVEENKPLIDNLIDPSIPDDYLLDATDEIAVFLSRVSPEFAKGREIVQSRLEEIRNNDQIPEYISDAEVTRIAVESLQFRKENPTPRDESPHDLSRYKAVEDRHLAVVDAFTSEFDPIKRSYAENILSEFDGLGGDQTAAIALGLRFLEERALYHYEVAKQTAELSIFDHIQAGAEDDTLKAMAMIDRCKMLRREFYEVSPDFRILDDVIGNIAHVSTPSEGWERREAIARVIKREFGVTVQSPLYGDLTKPKTTQTISQ